jgi:uncharacterized protein (TIGR03435 family)
MNRRVLVSGHALQAIAWVTMMLVAAGGVASIGQAQAPADSAAKLPQWDVVSIKQMDANSCTGGRGALLEKDALTFHCVPLMFVVEMSYQIMEPSRILGAPEWMKGGTLWEIDAKVAGGDVAAFGKLSRSQRDLMVRALLIDRLHLKAHIEQREMPVYQLVIAKGGPKVKEARADEDDKAKIMSGHSGEIEAVAAQMDALPWMLGNEVGRPVVDKTGLTGKYDFTLEFVPEARAAADETGGPSIFTALEEQLGLKLVPAKDMAEVLVIDSIEQPGAN